MSLVFPLSSTSRLAKTGEGTSVGAGEMGEWFVWFLKVVRHNLRNSGSRLRGALEATGKRKVSNEER
jgi:hypothetical protein